MSAHAFTEKFADIAASAATRDDERLLPVDELSDLGRAGLGALRVPTEFGGGGRSVVDLTEILIDLAAADSNLVQALRSHFIFTDALAAAAPSPARDRWLHRIGDGVLLGGAHTERHSANTDRFATTLTTDTEGRFLLNGVKFYSTGSLFAEWIVTNAESADGLVTVLVNRHAPGVTLVDDWDGFGQKLTASGTSRFENVVVDPDEQLPALDIGSYGTSFAQQLHLIALAGIARAAHDETVGYVRGRERYFAQGTGRPPRFDPLVQEIIGELSAAAYLAATLVRDVARALDRLATQISAGGATGDLEDHVEVLVYRAQVLIIKAVLDATTRLFDVGGASALSTSKRWDRFWRNARTLSSHNPVSYRLASIGDFELNGTSPFRAWFSGVDLRDRVTPVAAHPRP